jgi:hypothetical protein
MKPRNSKPILPNSAQDETAELEAHLAELGYPHWEESDNPAYRLFLG